MAKVALLIGVSEYGEGLKALPAPPKDVAAMQEVLQNPEMGGFDEVKTLVNPNHSDMAVEIETWFESRQSDDLTVLFFSGHGVKDESRELYFAACDTRKINERLIKATAVSANFVRSCLRRSKSKRQVVILDCCFSGAFGDLLAKDDGDVDLESQLGTEGGVVLTSSSSLQYSFEQQGSDLSIYTRYLVEGIQTGAADGDGDGAVSVDELHQFASKKVQAAAPAMTPKIIVLKELGYKIKLAKAPIGDPKLKYRKEVECRVYQGKFSIPARRLLKRRCDELGLSSEEADTIEAEVLQPYREHQHKLKEYEDTLAEALQEENPLSDRTREHLKDYQKHLGLSDEDVKEIEQQLPVDKHADYQKQQEEAERQQQQPQSTQTPISRSPDETDNFSSEWPVDDTGENTSVRCPNCYHINPRGVPQCEACYTPLPHEICPSCSANVPPGNNFCNRCGFNLTLVKTKKETRPAQQKLGFGSSSTRDSDSFSERSTDDLSSERGVNYTKLRDLLASGQWKEADQETLAVMLKAANREQEGYLEIESIEEFPCTDLRTIDQLWVKYSNGRFGFSVQKRIWESLGGKSSSYYYEIYQKVGDRVGWLKWETVWLGLKKEAKWLEDDDIIYDLNAPQGHLPWRSGQGRRNVLFSRAETCKL
jgi:hypothetical protein